MFLILKREVVYNVGLVMVQTTTVIELGTKAFVIQGQPDYNIQLTDSPDIETLSCFILNSTSNLRDDLQKAYLSWLQDDDVFCDIFLRNVCLVSTEVDIEESVLQLLASWGCQYLFHIPGGERISPGPYFFSSRGIFSPWRLFPDDSESFVLSTIPTQQDPQTSQTLNAAAFGASSLCVAVPSRLKSSKANHQPLAGMRVAVKDLFHLKGVNTGCGNRAYRELHGPVDSSSNAVKRVIDLGGVIVGKTKTVEFGGSQEVIGDWCDYFDPMNGLRPTRVLFPREYWSDHSGVQQIAEHWVASLAEWLGADKVDISVEETWKATKPPGAEGGFFDTFNETFIAMIYREFWTYLADFRSEYQEKFKADPYVNKGKLISDDRRQEAVDEVSLHNNWFLEHLLNDQETIMIIPRYKLDYRDEYLP
ncbi:hypothetical protein CSPX01_11941 [Colletotrichum filicis]|nr:hypothetical protein CSPX01_11941 [Colletotrichum filicis]